VIKTSYHTLGAVIFIWGLVLQLKWPGQDETIGQQLFQAYSIPVTAEIGISYVWIVSIIIQVSGILLFLKWLSIEHPKFLKKYTQFEPVFLVVLLFAIPFVFNSLLSTSAKTYIYAAENGANAIEYLESECTIEDQDEGNLYECKIILQNYEHQSQQVTLHFPVSDSIKKEKQVTAYLQVHEKKEIRVQFTADELAVFEGVPEFTIQS
jgi:hypothetical protein